jgi:hypothetical protein
MYVEVNDPLNNAKREGTKKMQESEVNCTIPYYPYISLRWNFQIGPLSTASGAQ